MFFLNELKDLKLYRKKFLYPINEENKKKNSLVMLMTPSYHSSLSMMKYPLLVNKYFKCYYMERAAMYYISGNTVIEESCDILKEDIRNILNNDAKSEILYSGYENDTIEVMKVLHPDYFVELSKKFDIPLDYPIYIDVCRKSKIQESNDNILHVSSRATYNKTLKNYNAYLRFCAVDFVLRQSKQKLDPSIRYSISLYESDLYEIHKNHWIFHDKLKSLSESIQVYIKRNGYKKFAKEVIHGDQRKLLTDTIGHFIQKDIDFIGGLFGVREESNLLIEDESETKNYISEEGILEVGKECLFLFQEDASYNTIVKKLLYNDRIKNLQEMKEIYDKVKEDVPYIKYTYNMIDKYNGLNLIVDFSRYNESFLKNNTYKNIKGYNVYFELMQRLINDKRFDKDYKYKTVIIPIPDWDLVGSDKRPWMIMDHINPISCFYQTLMKSPATIRNKFPNTIFLFAGKNGYFKIDTSNEFKNNAYQLFLRYIKSLRNDDFIPEEDPNEKTISPKAITADIVDKIEKSQGVEINDLSMRSKDEDEKKKESNKPKTEKEVIKQEEEEKKSELVEKISKAAEINNTVDDTIDELDNDEYIKKILADLSEDADKKANISAARASHLIKMQDDLMEKEFKGKPLKELINGDINSDEKPLPERSLKVDSVNEEWQKLTYCNTFEAYNPDEDIVKMFQSLSEMNPPLYISKIEVVDNSTSEDAVDLYTVQYEDLNGKRFTIKLDIPKFIDNKYMLLRGNRKDISSQLFLMPIIKTAEDTVQIVSNYNKIFIRRFGTSFGKSNECSDRLVKTVTKNKFENLKVVEGDNSRVCSRYELPIDYIDLASGFSKFITPSLEIYFNQDELHNKFNDKIDMKKGIPIGVYTKNKEIIYYNSLDSDGNPISCAYYIALLLSTDNKLDKEGFYGIYEKTARSIRYTYSRASIMSSEIPLIVICAYSEGLTKVLKKGNIKYHFENSKKDINKDSEDFIRFKDAYLIYTSDYAASLLLNGLKACNTEDYSIKEINDKAMYLDFLDNFGGRIKADGLDNFYNLMIDKPITYDVLQYYKLPTDYIEVLLYANRLLADNKFIKHTSLTDNRRIRRNEQIPAMLYTVLAKAYGEYCTQLKHGRTIPMTIKQSAVIDEVLLNSTTSDKSIINALNEYEAYTLVTPKGPAGMNSDRSYTLDKRSYDESMFNVLSMSTGFAGNVGISRQTTIDSNISTVRGYVINKENPDQLSPTKSFCMTEALTPFGTTRDDPFRSAMNYVQTSRHEMRCKRSNPGLITTGADEALPYLVSNLFAKKADKDGKIVSIDEKRMLVEYKDGTKDYIDLTNHVEKNSSSGFYVNLKLDTDLVEGRTFKKGDILAYDKHSFSNEVGPTNNIAYNIGTLAKFAILNTDEGYEDSAIISADLSDAMTSEVVLMCPNHPIILSKDTNVYNLVKVGQEIKEGDTLLTIQRAYDDEDSNMLLKNLVDNEEDITNIGRVPIRSKVTGVVQDIVICRTVDINELSPSLKKIVTEYERDLKRKKKEMKEYGIENPDLYAGSTDKLAPIGKLKNASECVSIEIYLKYEDKMSVGDKLIYYSALKGVVKDIFPEGEEPKSSYRPNEKIHALLSLGSVNGRMTGSILINGAITKYIIELTRKCKDILGIKYPDNLFDQ